MGAALFSCILFSTCHTLTLITHYIKHVTHTHSQLLDFCDKGTLASAIDQGWLRERRLADAPIRMPLVLAYALDAARGLAYLHSHCVVHGDLTAENVLLQVSVCARQCVSVCGMASRLC